MEPWKILGTSVVGVVSSVALAQEYQAVYINSQHPQGSAKVPVEVGDVIELRVEGPAKIIGRYRDYTVLSYYEETQRRGCKMHKKNIDFSRDRIAKTEARLFEHYYPAVILPGTDGKPIPLKEAARGYVVKEKGDLQLTDLVFDANTLYLKGVAPARNAKEDSDIRQEMQIRKLQGHHGMKVTRETARPTNQLKVIVTIKIERTQP